MATPACYAARVTVYRHHRKTRAHPKGKWMIDVEVELPDGSTKRVRKTAPVQTKEAAERYEGELRRSILDGTYGREGVTFAEVAARWLEQHADATCKPGTARRYHELVNLHLVPELGKLSIDAITRADVERAHRAIGAKDGRDGPAHGTANRALLCASAIFGWAEGQGLREGSNPARGIKKFREAGAGYFYSAAEYARIDDALDEGRLSWGITAVIRLCMLTGCRLSDAINLRWREVDLDRSQLVLGDSKTGRSIRPMMPAAVEFLRALKRDSKTERVCVTGNETPVDTAHVDRAWRSIRKRASLPDGARLHDLRHTAGSLALEAGMPLPLVSKMLGHKSVATTAKIYAHVLDAMAAVHMERFGDAFAATLARGRGEG